MCSGQLAAHGLSVGFGPTEHEKRLLAYRPLHHTYVCLPLSDKQGLSELSPVDNYLLST
jgi:hypothetical protein